MITPIFIGTQKQPSNQENQVQDIFKKFIFNGVKFAKNFHVDDIKYELTNSPLGAIVVKELEEHQQKVAAG